MFPQAAVAAATVALGVQAGHPALRHPPFVGLLLAAFGDQSAAQAGPTACYVIALCKAKAALMHSALCAPVQFGASALQ